MLRHPKIPLSSTASLGWTALSAGHKSFFNTKTSRTLTWRQNGRTSLSHHSTEHSPSRIRKTHGQAPLPVRMEALAAVSLAGNVMQFVDFSSKIISEARAIEKNGESSSIADLQRFASNSTKHAGIIRSRLQASSYTRPLSEENQVRASRISQVFANLGVNRILLIWQRTANKLEMSSQFTCPHFRLPEQQGTFYTIWKTASESGGDTKTLSLSSRSLKSSGAP